MGVSQTPWTTSSMPGGAGTTLCDVNLEDISWAGYCAGSKIRTGSQDFEGNEMTMTPLKMDVAGNWCCCLILPHGFASYATNSLSGPVDIGTGCHCICPWTNVNYVVPLHTIVFDSPQLQCPTQDNITVTISASVTFKVREVVEEVGKGIEHFVEMNPAVSLNQKLQESMSEAMRLLTAQTPHSQVYDLQGRDCKAERDRMHAKLWELGIDVKHFLVQKVTLPAETEHRMQEETMTIVEQRVNTVTALEQSVTEKNRDELEMLRKKATINQEMAESEAQKEQAGIQVRTASIANETQHMVQMMEAEKDRTVEETLNNAGLKEAELISRADLVKREVETKVAVELNDLEQEGRQYKVDKETELATRAAQDRAEAADLVAKSEKEGGASLALARKFEQDKAQLEVLAKLVQNRKLRIASTAEVNARGMTFNDDRATQFVHSAMRFFHAKFTDSSLAPSQEPLLKS